MASYFDEHDCLPLGENERPNDQLLLARFLIDSGIATDLGLNFEDAISRLPPPISKVWLDQEFPKCLFNEASRPGIQCPICLKV